MTTDYLGNETHENLIGLTVTEADALLAPDNFVRVIKEDGEPLIGTCDYLPERINVATESGKISAIEGEG